jgi:hypothetical protein
LEDEMNQNKPMQFSGEVTPENLQTYTTKRLQSMENPSSKGRNLLIEVYDMIKPQLHRQSLMESLSQQPQHTMGVPDKPFEMRPEDALPIGGILRGGKGVLGLVKGQGPKVDYFRKQAEKSLLKEYEALEKQFRGRDIRKTLSSPVGKEQVENSVLLDYILKSLKGKIKGQGLIE